MMSRTTLTSAVLGVVAVLSSSGAALAGPTADTRSAVRSERSAAGGSFPDTIALPTGFQPEGITIGRQPYAYLGSLADGSIYRANLVTGRGQIISQGPGTSSVGMKLDSRGLLFVAGGAAGDARVVDTASGEVVASFPLATGTTFVNDVVLTPDAAWFTDSSNAVLYKVPLGPRGALPDADEVVRVPLGGDWQQVPGFNANGIARTPDGRALLVVQSATGLLFRVDPGTGVATQVDLGGQSMSNGDGLLLLGCQLYVVRNQLNEVAVVSLNRAGTTGTVTERLTDEGFDVPTTVAAWGSRLYLPNARFGIADPATAEYTVTAINR